METSNRMDHGRSLSSANVTYIISNVVYNVALIYIMSHYGIQYRLTEQKSTILMLAYINDGLYTLMHTGKRTEACP